MMFFKMHRHVLYLLALSFLVVGCVSETNRVEPSAQPRDANGLPQEVQRIPLQMQKLSGDLLRYHARHQELPASLDVLVDADIMTLDSFNDLPDYLYLPAGQCVLSDGRMVLLVDSEPRIEGHAWCIVREPSDARRSVLLNVRPVSLKELDAATR